MEGDGAASATTDPSSSASAGLTATASVDAAAPGGGQSQGVQASGSGAQLVPYYQPPPVQRLVPYFALDTATSANRTYRSEEADVVRLAFGAGNFASLRGSVPTRITAGEIQRLVFFLPHENKFLIVQIIRSSEYPTEGKNYLTLQ